MVIFIQMLFGISAFIFSAFLLFLLCEFYRFFPNIFYFLLALPVCYFIGKKIYEAFL